jgi:hypothetical protein
MEQYGDTRQPQYGEFPEPGFGPGTGTGWSQPQEPPRYESYPQQEHEQQDYYYVEEPWYAEEEPFPLEPLDEPAPSGYEIPDVPEAGWSADHSSRRSWIGRTLLLGVLIIQAALSLRLHNTAYQDEALYLYAGRVEVNHLLHGAVLHTDYSTFFSGSPWLYPVLAGAVDMKFGLVGARLLSLLFMLGTTTLLYSLTRRLFNERVAICSAGLYAVLQSTIVMGYYATYDSAAVFLIALANWIVVRTARAPAAAVLLAAPVMVLAVGVKYASALFLPSIVVLAVLCAWPHRGGRALVRGLLLSLGTGAMLYLGAKYTNVMSGVQATTTSRAPGTESTLSILAKSGQWGGLMFGLACFGAVAYVWRDRMNEVPNLREATRRRLWRISLAGLLTGTALLAPAYQIHLHTSVSLFKHLGFGLLFAAPMAGLGITRLVGAHFRQPQLGILVWVLMLALGVSQSQWRYQTWPDSSQLISVLKQHVDKKGVYLSESDNVPAYYLHDVTTGEQWTNTYGIGFRNTKGVMLHGDAGFQAAVEEGHYNLIVLDGISTPETDQVISKAILAGGEYRLVAKLPFSTSAGPGSYQVYVKQ